MAALHQRRQRLPQRSNANPYCFASSRSGGSFDRRAKGARPDRGPEPLDRLLESTRRLHRHEDRLKRRVALHVKNLPPA